MKKNNYNYHTKQLICMQMTSLHARKGYERQDKTNNTRMMLRFKLKTDYYYNTTTTTTTLQPFVRDYPDELVPKETFTHSHL